MGMTFDVRRQTAGAVVIGALAVLCAACTTPGAPAAPLPACPARAEVLLEPADPVAFSLPRAVSEDGGWIVTSRAVGDRLDLSLRRTEDGSSSTPVGSMEVGLGDRAFVAVTPGATHVVFGVSDDDATTPPWPWQVRRWDRATGTTQTVEAPAVAAPPPGEPGPPQVEATDDGRRLFWRHGYRSGDGPATTFEYVTTVTDPVTDDVLVQRAGEGFGSPTSRGSHRMSWDGLIDTGTGATTDLRPLAAEVTAALPGPDFQAVAVSDNGRYMAFQRRHTGQIPVLYETVLWDRTTSTGTVPAPIETVPVSVEEISDQGDVLWSRRVYGTGPLRGDVVLSRLDGTRSVDVPLALDLSPYQSYERRAVGNPDLSTVVASRQTPFGFELVALRCS
jgi:hypothetical protein